MSHSAPSTPRADGAARRARLDSARLMLIFTPGLCGPHDPEHQLRLLATEVDVIQVRCKAPASGAAEVSKGSAPAEARATLEWTRRAIAICDELARPPLVLVDDRVDVALMLRDAGCAGVHLGTHDFPVEKARELLGPDALIGYSTHDAIQVALAADTSADYLGLGPIFETATKGYESGLGPEVAWIAQAGSSLPLFPIGGIDLSNAHTLHHVGRAAIGAGLLSSAQPVETARRLRAALSEAD